MEKLINRNEIAITSQDVRATGTIIDGLLTTRDLTAAERGFLARADLVRRCTSLADIANGGCAFVAAATKPHWQFSAQAVDIWQIVPGQTVRLELVTDEGKKRAAVAEIENRHARIIENGDEPTFAAAPNSVMIYAAKTVKSFDCNEVS